MLSVHLICVGKLKEKFYKDACAEYVKRLSSYCKLTLAEIPEVKLPKEPTLGEVVQALAKEGEAIRAKYPVERLEINYVGPVIGNHSGPGTLALFFQGKHK